MKLLAAGLVCLLLSGCVFLDVNGYYTKKKPSTNPISYCEVQVTPNYFQWMPCRDNDRYEGRA